MTNSKQEETNKKTQAEAANKRQEIEKKVFEVVSNVLAVPQNKLNLNSSFKEDLGADSLAIAEIANEIEATFSLTFETEDIEKIKKVGDAVNHIEKVLQKRK